MQCKLTYGNESLTEQEFSEKYIPHEGEIIEMNSIEYRVHNSSMMYSDIISRQFADGSLIYYEDGDQEAEKMINTANQIPVYNLDPVGDWTVVGGIDPIFNIPLIDMLKIGFSKTGKKFDWNKYKNAFGNRERTVSDEEVQDKIDNCLPF